MDSVRPILTRCTPIWPVFAVAKPTIRERVWELTRLPLSVVVFVAICVSWSIVMTLVLPPGLQPIAFALGLPGGAIGMTVAMSVFER